MISFALCVERYENPRTKLYCPGRTVQLSYHGSLSDSRPYRTGYATADFCTKERDALTVCSWEAVYDMQSCAMRDSEFYFSRFLEVIAIHSQVERTYEKKKSETRAGLGDSVLVLGKLGNSAKPRSWFQVDVQCCRGAPTNTIAALRFVRASCRSQHVKGPR